MFLGINTLIFVVLGPKLGVKQKRSVFSIMGKSGII